MQNGGSSWWMFKPANNKFRERTMTGHQLSLQLSVDTGTSQGRSLGLTSLLVAPDAPGGVQVHCGVDWVVDTFCIRIHQARNRHKQVWWIRAGITRTFLIVWEWKYCILMVEVYWREAQRINITDSWVTLCNCNKNVKTNTSSRFKCLAELWFLCPRFWFLIFW